MNLFTIPPGAPFLDAIAAAWLHRAGDDRLAAARGLILLPTRRAARALADAFLRAAAGRPLLLPRITAIGALDETPLALSGALDLPPAIGTADRLAGLSRLILALGGRDGAPRAADGAWRLAGELATLMDEAERAEIDLATQLPRATADEFAAHWQRTLEFLTIVTRAWPDHLAERGLMNPAARQVALLRAQASAWDTVAPADPVWAAGLAGATPSVAELMRVIAGLPHGAVILPGLEQGMEEPAWQAIEATHPQAGLQRLLAGMGVRRTEVEVWPGARSPQATRARMLGRTLLPAPVLDLWHAAPAPDLTGLTRLDAADEQHEAAAIALILRDVLDTPRARAALVTPDRALAGRVAAELGRFGIIADDSAGEPLAETPPALFLRLLARAAAEKLAPVPLLALLKHPLAAAGLAPAACRDRARQLERRVLRGPRPGPGITGLRLALGEHTPGEADDRAEARDLLARLETCLAPLIRCFATTALPPEELLSALVEAAEALARTDKLPGPAILWSAEEGEALAEQLSEARGALGAIGTRDPAASLPGLLDAVLEGAVVRSRRALRGRDGVEHPRIFIWGLLEARLQAVDVMVLGGLVEGIWPPQTDPGPWLSRPMRRQVGLPAPEEAVGQAAHDFLAAACAAPQVVLSCPRRRDGAPAVPARWLARLDAFLQLHGADLPAHPAAGWARALDRPDGPARPVTPPRPAPDIRHRPRSLRVTEVETWLTDPFAIYARHVLRLRKLDPLDQITDVTDYGTLVHDGMHRFLRAHGIARGPDSVHLLAEAMQTEMAKLKLRDSLQAFWAPRLARIAAWAIAAERDAPACTAISSEVSGKWQLSDHNFELRGRADRIERRDQGLAIVDYKTGTPPGVSAVNAGRAPQLPLEAAMAAAGAFGPEWRGPIAALTYWHLTGRTTPGETREILKDKPADIAALVQGAADGLRGLIAAYDDPAQPYLAQPFPGAVPRYSDYAQLARVAEWSSGTGGEE